MILSRNLANLIVEEKVSVEDIVTLLTKYNLLGLLPAIKEKAEEIASHAKRGDTLAIETPFPLSIDTISLIKKMTGNDTAIHEITINKNILAGFKARCKGKLYDGSAERIVRQLTK